MTTTACQPLGRILCTQAPGPHPNGCTYEAPSVSDAHDASEDAAERSRG